MKVAVLSVTSMDKKVLLALLEQVSDKDWTLSCKDELQSIALLQCLESDKKDCYQLVREADHSLKHIHVTIGFAATVGMLARMHNFGLIVSFVKSKIHKGTFLVIATGDLSQWRYFLNYKHLHGQMRALVEGVRNELSSYSLVLR